MRTRKGPATMNSLPFRKWVDQHVNPARTEQVKRLGVLLPSGPYIVFDDRMGGIVCRRHRSRDAHRAAAKLAIHLKREISVHGWGGSYALYWPEGVRSRRVAEQ